MTNDNLRVGLYARVSGEQQEKEDTIASQLEAVTQRVASDGLECEPELCFVDDGYSGYILARPGLERLRDQAAAGLIDRLYVLDPDRFSRKYAYQVLILEELTRCGVEVVFLRNPPGHGPEENLLLQVQGVIAEYERAKIMERCRRGKQYAARRGSVNVLSGAALRLSLRRQARRWRRGALSGHGRRGSGGAEDLPVVWPGTLFDRRGLPASPKRRHSHADRQISLGPLGGLADPQEPRLQGDGGLRQDPLGRPQAAAPPPAARPPRAASATHLTDRYIIGRSNIH